MALVQSQQFTGNGLGVSQAVVAFRAFSSSQGSFLVSVGYQCVPFRDTGWPAYFFSGARERTAASNSEQSIKRLRIHGMRNAIRNPRNAGEYFSKA
jgi:hypothetical protein